MPDYSNHFNQFFDRINKAKEEKRQRIREAIEENEENTEKSKRMIEIVRQSYLNGIKTNSEFIISFEVIALNDLKRISRCDHHGDINAMLHPRVDLIYVLDTLRNDYRIIPQKTQISFEVYQWLFDVVISKKDYNKKLWKRLTNLPKFTVLEKDKYDDICRINFCFNTEKGNPKGERFKYHKGERKRQGRSDD